MKSMRAYLFIFTFVGLSTVSGCDADTANHLPGVDPWMDGNPVDFAEFAANADPTNSIAKNAFKPNTPNTLAAPQEVAWGFQIINAITGTNI